MYNIKYTSQLKKDYKLAIKRGNDISLLQKIVELIASGQPLPDKYKEHALSGNWGGYKECHLAPDWLLIYYIEENISMVTFARTGSHSDLF
jgi:mRNA interferase YafQ